jgi:hypothetical protein
VNLYDYALHDPYEIENTTRTYARRGRCYRLPNSQGKLAV